MDNFYMDTILISFYCSLEQNSDGFNFSQQCNMTVLTKKSSKMKNISKITYHPDKISHDFIRNKITNNIMRERKKKSEHYRKCYTKSLQIL